MAFSGVMLNSKVEDEPLSIANFWVDRSLIPVRMAGASSSLLHAEKIVAKVHKRK